MIGKLDLYRVFAEVARCRSFSGAAKALFMTQPAVSLAIMNLEKELGTRLFIRTPRGVSLTNEGKLLYEYISSAMNLVRMGEAKVAESCGLESGELKIGVGDTVSKYFLLPHLEEFHRNYPNIKLRVINRTTPELCAMVKAGEVDLAICNLPIRDPSLSVRVCGTIHDIFVCGEKYREACCRIRRFEQLVELPLILLETKSNSRQYVERFMLSRGIKLRPEIELGSHDLLLEFARFNFGIACVIEEFSQDYLQKGLLWKVELEEAIPERAIGFCTLKSVSLSPSSARFVEIVESRLG